MKYLLAVLLFVALPASPCAAQTQPQADASAGAPRTAPEHPATSDQVREYFKLVRLDQTVHNIMEQMLKAAQATSAPYYPQSVWDDMRTTFGNYDLMTDMVPIYQRHISQEDMSAILSFYHSPSGERLLAAQPVMVAEAQAIFPAVGRKLGEEVAARHMEEIKAAKQKYDEDLARKSSSTPK
jgi:hypothetical protein